MASSRSTNNKYASLNFNDIHQKKHHPSSSSSASPLTTPTTKKILSNSRIHGNMLVLTRPAPKPVPQPSPPSTPPQPQLQQSPTTPDPISLRPLGRTGSGPTLIPSPPHSAEAGQGVLAVSFSIAQVGAVRPAPSPAGVRRPGGEARSAAGSPIQGESGGDESAWFEWDSAEFQWTMISSEVELLPRTTTSFEASAFSEWTATSSSP